jgi:hypothetical protein
VVGVAALNARRQRCAGRVAGLGRAGQQEVDGRGHQLDVAQLLRGDVGDEVVVGLELIPSPIETFLAEETTIRIPVG